MEIGRIQIKRKTKETIDIYTYSMTFNTHKIPKEIKIGYQKLNVDHYIPNPLRCYKCQRFGHHHDQCTQLPVCRRCREYGIHNNNQKDYKCANCLGNHGADSRDNEIWKKEITKLKRATKYAEVIKEISQQPKNKSCYVYETSATTKPKVVAQLVNEMRALI